MSLQRALLSAAMLFFFCAQAFSASVSFFNMLPYTQAGDADSLFDTSKPISVEDFEDNSVDPFLQLTGVVLPPFFEAGGTINLTDSVDGDDGVLDNNGNGGHSFFSSGRSITITFAEPVSDAGLVWTDGDTGTAGAILEAFDENGLSLGFRDYPDLADGHTTGTAAEDRYLGLTSEESDIKMLIVTNLPAGDGIEIDHIHWQIRSMPEPASCTMAIVGSLALLGLRRARKD